MLSETGNRIACKSNAVAKLQSASGRMQASGQPGSAARQATSATSLSLRLTLDIDAVDSWHYLSRNSE